MNLTAEHIQDNWNLFLHNIKTHISGDRMIELGTFYRKHEDDIMLMPASHKKAFHNCFPGGYIDHVNRVVDCSLRLLEVWEVMGVDMSTFTKEELIFSAINHDLGKMGDGERYAHIPSEDDWRKRNLGEMYKFNTNISFMSVPERSLYILNQAGIEMSENEWIGIRTHDGMYDDANKAYLASRMPELKPRTSLVYILHHADMMATRIEFEKEWNPQLKEDVNPSGKPINLSGNKKPTGRINPNSRALKSIKSEGLKNLLDNL